MTVKRISLVWKRPDISGDEFRRRWLGEHAAYAKQLQGVEEYVVDFVGEGPDDGPSGIATLRFATRQALDAAFQDQTLNAHLLRTREQFAAAVQVLIAEEEIVCR